MDADALPAEVDRWEIRKAMGVLKMLAQSDLERELYESRLKARRDMQTLETERRMAEEQRVDWQQRYEAANREREAANPEREAAKRMLVRQIQLCQRLLGRRGSNAEELTACSLDELRDLAERLERESTPGLQGWGNVGRWGHSPSSAHFRPPYLTGFGWMDSIARRVVNRLVIGGN